MKKNLFLIGAIGFGLVVQEGRAQPQPAPQRNQSQTSSQSARAMSTEAFVKKVAEDNQMEVDVARLASTRAKSPQVKDYAQQLIKDHTNSGETLKRYASRHNMTIPATSAASKASKTSQATASNRSNTATQTPEALARTDDSNSKELAAKSGADFDQAFIHMMVQDHQKAISLFEAQKNASNMDSEIRSFVNNTLPVLRRHLTRAVSIEKSLGSTTTQSHDTHSTTNPSNTRPATPSPSNNNPSRTQ